MQLVVLAGGLGTRLKGSIPEGVPKPMAEVGGRPFLEHLLDASLEQGVRDVVLLVSHLADSVSHHFGASYRGVPVRYSVEPEPLGTGGAIRHAASMLNDEFVLMTGDTFAQVSYSRLVDHLDRDVMAMSLTPVDDLGRFGAVATEGDRAVELLEKRGSGPGLINAGIYACRLEILELFPSADRFSFETDVLEPSLPRVRPPFERTGPHFFDIGVPADLAAADQFFGQNRA